MPVGITGILVNDVTLLLEGSDVETYYAAILAGCPCKDDSHKSLSGNQAVESQLSQPLSHGQYLLLRLHQITTADSLAKRCSFVCFLILVLVAAASFSHSLI